MYFPASKSPGFHSTIWSSDFPATSPKCPKTYNNYHWSEEREKSKNKRLMSGGEKRAWIWRVATTSSSAALHDNMELSQLYCWFTARY